MNEAPYCGPPPVPATLLATWNLDPLILPILGLLAAFLVLSSGLSSRIAFRRPASSAAWLVLLIAFVSPICALSSALFSARVFHHLLLISVAAPLFALAVPTRFARLPVVAVFVVHTFLVWFWHAPAPYEAAIDSQPLYWLMEMSLLISAIMLWQGVFSSQVGPALSALLGTVVQMGLLGALLTLSAEPHYGPHFGTTFAFGLSPLEDQQLAGLIMWAPAAAPYLAATIYLIWDRLLQREFASAER